MRLRSALSAAAMLILLAGAIPACQSSENAPPSDEAPVAFVDDVADRMEALYRANPSAGPSDLLALLAGSRELVETGTSEDGAYGVFADGRVIMLVDDRGPSRSAATRIAHAPTSSLHTLGIYDTDTAPYELTTSDYVQIHDSLGTLFTPYWQTFKPWFDKDTYLTSIGAGGVEDLKNLSNQAVVYVAAHGGRFTMKDGEQLTAVGTSTPINAANDALYADDGKHRRLVHMLNKHDLRDDGSVTVARVYGITQHFVTQYTELRPDSLVVIDACRSADLPLMSAFLAKGASLYGGWTGKVYDADSQRAVTFFFDRMLAANEVYVQTPPQRPFNYDETMMEMFRLGVDRAAAPGGGTTSFTVVPNGAQSLGLLRPSIKHLTLNAPAQTIILNGSFGSMKEHVRINGHELACEYWYSDVVICNVGPTGATGVGDVVVDTRDISSNPRRITEWKGAFTYTGRSGCGPGSARGLVATVRGNVRFRADVGSFREHAGLEPITAPIQFDVEMDKTVFTSATGECSYSWGPGGSETTRWSGSAEVPWGDDHSVGVVDVPNHRLRLHLELYSGGDALHFATTCNGTLCAQGNAEVNFQTGEEGFKDGDDSWAEAVFDIPLDADWNAAAGSRQQAAPAPADWDLPQGTLSWTTITATSAPDPNAAR